MSEPGMETAVKDPDGDDTNNYIEVDGGEGFDHRIRFSQPDEDQVLFIMSRITSKKESTRNNAFRRLINAIVDMMDEESSEAVEDRLMDPDDEFGIEDLIGLWESMLEESAERPTKPSSDSSGSPKPTGRKSTVRASERASTSQRSKRAAS